MPVRRQVRPVGGEAIADDGAKPMGGAALEDLAAGALAAKTVRGARIDSEVGPTTIVASQEPGSGGGPAKSRSTTSRGVSGTQDLRRWVARAWPISHNRLGSSAFSASSPSMSA